MHSMMTYRSDDRGENYCGAFREDCESALRRIDIAKANAERDIIAALTRLRDICSAQIDRTVPMSTEVEKAFDAEYKVSVASVVDMVGELAVHAESTITAEMEG
jgi:hypothetical protein